MAMPVVGATPGPQPSTPAPISSDGKKSKTRTSITPQQLEVLMAVYNREQRPSKLVREDLMAKTGLEMKVIQVWFQNRRSKEKRDGTTAATPTTSIGMPTVNAREELGAVATPIASVIATPMDEGAPSIESPLPQSEGNPHCDLSPATPLTCTYDDEHDGMCHECVTSKGYLRCIPQ